MEGPSGGTASTLIALVMAQLQNRGLVDLEHIEQATWQHWSFSASAMPMLSMIAL
jgi:hypothetical protein